MDVQDQSKQTNPSGHETESHVVHLCHRCGWPFPNPHPSARHRRAHKKICGTIEGYTTLIDSEAVSDDEPHLDDDKEKTPSPKIEKKKSVGDSGGTGGRFSRSEEDMFSDAVTEFSDSGVEDRSASSKSLDRDLFFSFKDAENGGTDKVLDAPIEISNVKANVTVSENVEKIGETEITTVCDSSEAKLELTDKDGKCSTGLVEDRVVEPTHGQSDMPQSQEAGSVDVVKAGKEKVQETQTFENEELDVPATVTKEAKNVEVQASDTSKPTPEISASIGGYDDNVEQEKLEKLSDVIGEKLDSASKDVIIEEIKQEKFKSDCEIISEVVHGVEGISEEIKHEKFELDNEHAREVTIESEINQKKVQGVREKHEKFESDHEHASEVVKEPEVDQCVPFLTEKEDLGASMSEKCSKDQILEVLKEPDTGLTEKEDPGAPGSEFQSNPGAPESEKCSTEQVQEVFKEPDTGLTEKEDRGAPESEFHSNPGAPESEKCSTEQVQEVFKEPDTVLTKMEDPGAAMLEKCSDKDTNVVVEEPDSFLTEKEDLGAPKSEICPSEDMQEVVKGLESVLTEKEDLDAPKSEERSNEHTREVVKKPGTVLIENENLGATNSEECSNEQTATNSEECSNEQTQEVVKEPDTVLIEKDLGAPKLENCSNEHTQEDRREPDTVLTEKKDLGAPNLEESPKEHTLEVVEGLSSISTEKEEIGASNSEKCSNEHTQEVIKEPKVDNNSEVVADVSIETITLKEDEQSAKDLERASDNSIADDKNDSGVVSKPNVEGTGKLMTNQDSVVDLSVDSSSHNSLEGNWGSVSVLSTASVDAETVHSIDKLKVNSGKLVAADNPSGTSDIFEPPSFMTLVEPEGKDQKPASSEVHDKDGQQPPKSEALQAGWFPTLTNVNNESEGRKRNEEVIAKVTNWSTGKPSTPLKSLLGEAKSPNAKQPETVVQKDETATATATLKASLPSEAPAANRDLLSSPPKLIEDGKKAKKAKGRGSWMPFVCCSSVNVN